MQAAQDFCQAERGAAEAVLRIALHVWFLYYWVAGYVSEGRYRLGRVLARAGEPTVWRAQGLLLGSFLAARAGLVTASPVRPVRGVAGRVRALEGCG